MTAPRNRTLHIPNSEYPCVSTARVQYRFPFGGSLFNGCADLTLQQEKGPLLTIGQKSGHVRYVPIDMPRLGSMRAVDMLVDVNAHHVRRREAAIPQSAQTDSWRR